MRKICNNVVEYCDNDITCDKKILKCTQFCLSAAFSILTYRLLDLKQMKGNHFQLSFIEPIEH